MSARAVRKAGHPLRGNTKKQAARRAAKNISAVPVVARESNGKFLKGVSGNPNGRPTASHEVRELAREHGPEAIERLVFWMRSGEAQNSITAAKILLDRGFGKAFQPVAGTGTGPLVNIQLGSPNGAPITAAEAMAAYQAMCANPGATLVEYAPVDATEAIETKELPK